MRQITLFIEMTLQVILDKGGPKFAQMSMERNSETAMAHKNKT